MKKVFLGIVLFLLLSGCNIGIPSQGKWLDYGNGMVNLANVTHIKPVYANVEDDNRYTYKVLNISCAIVFDNFTLQLGESSPCTTPSNLGNGKYCSKEEIDAFTTAQKPIVDAYLSKIRNFIASDKTYMGSE